MVEQRTRHREACRRLRERELEESMRRWKEFQALPPREKASIRSRDAMRSAAIEAEMEANMRKLEKADRDNWRQLKWFLGIFATAGVTTAAILWPNRKVSP